MYCAGVATGVIMTVLSVIFIIVPGVHVSHSSVYCVMKVFYMMIIIEILIVLVLVLTIISKQDDIR